MEDKEHIPPLRLFDLTRDAQPTEYEKEHLQQCEECRTCHALLMPTSDRPKREKGQT
jgi:hypothetical protein